MSFINNNGLAPGFSPPGGSFTFGAGTAPGAPPLAPPPAGTDSIAYAPNPGASPFGTPGSGPNGAANQGAFGNLFSQFFATISGLMANLGSMLGYAPAQGAAPGSPQPNGPGQTFYANATANSVGDPHETFCGTTGAGTPIDQKWNSMIAHPNLLDSNSFAGGYRVSTTVTQPNANGITQNASATVTTGAGADSVTMRADGSYAVTSNGQSLTLPVGQPQPLANGETVTLNADKSLTITDTSATGGSITTTLKANGTGGVDVTNNAKDVDLGGSLVGHAQWLAGNSGGSAPASTASQPLPSPYVAPSLSLSALGMADPFAAQPAQLAAAGENDLAFM
jgi:hypothetical protein